MTIGVIAARRPPCARPRRRIGTSTGLTGESITARTSEKIVQDLSDSPYSALACSTRIKSLAIDPRAPSRSKSACSPSQNPSEVPKKAASRKAVSAVIPRFASTISLMRLGGTPVARASAFWLMSMGTRNSSRSTSPGWMFGIFFIACLGDRPRFQQCPRLLRSSLAEDHRGQGT